MEEPRNMPFYRLVKKLVVMGIPTNQVKYPARLMRTSALLPPVEGAGTISAETSFTSSHRKIAITKVRIW
jgi:hypothetical protein